MCFVAVDSTKQCWWSHRLSAARHDTVSAFLVWKSRRSYRMPHYFMSLHARQAADNLWESLQHFLPLVWALGCACGQTADMSVADVSVRAAHRPGHRGVYGA